MFDCILNENKMCIECGECNVCDLDSSKVCDNCCKCLDTASSDFKSIKIDDILLNVVDIEEK